LVRPVLEGAYRLDKEWIASGVLHDTIA
jgi:hypothetical protein